MRGAPRVWIVALAIALVALFAAPAAFAHEVGVSRGSWSAAAEEGRVVLSAEMAFSQREIEMASVDRTVIATTSVRGDDVPCVSALDDVRLGENDGVVVRAHWTCAGAPKSVRVTLGFFDDVSSGHRHFAHVAAFGAPFDATLFKGSATLDLAPGAAPAPSVGVLAMFRMGVEHILTGYDHLVFLLGLVLLGGRVRGIVKVITAFTLAHSITLALAALGVWAPSPRIVEPAIALSIAWVGMENVLVARLDPSRVERWAAGRWRITFPFGLIHGFGFAGALQEIALPRAQLPVALVTFNLGVEAGQLAVLAIVLPVVLWLRKRPAFALSGVRFASGAIVAAGVVWFVARVAGGS